MELYFKSLGIVLLLMMLMVLYRAIIGPTVIDRLVAANTIGTKTTVLILIIGVIFHRVDMFVDIAIAYALLNFIGSIAAAKFFYKYKTMHPEDQ